MGWVSGRPRRSRSGWDRAFRLTSLLVVSLVRGKDVGLALASMHNEVTIDRRRNIQRQMHRVTMIER